MSLFDIEKALQKAINSVSNIPDIAWPNIEFDPEIGTPFVRPTLIPANSVPLANGQYKQLGIYQIDVYVPTNKGIKTLYTIIDDIFDYFRANKTLTQGDSKILITRINTGRSERQDSWYSCSVEINYVCYN